MEQMAEQVASIHYQRLHHMLSESNWSRAEVRQQLIADQDIYLENQRPALPERTSPRGKTPTTLHAYTEV